MGPDDTLCCCYHVSLRKVCNYVRRERPPVPSLVSECLGAGTGCGWCVPYLRQVWCEVLERGESEGGGMDPARYGTLRARYLEDGTRPAGDE